MKHTRFVLSSLALLSGIGILALSLTTVTAAQSSTGSFEATQRKLYVGKEILPDHVAYPALMAIDRAKLEAATPNERVYMQVEYGNRRLEYTEKLLDKNNSVLALTTASKGYKYLLQAAQDTLDHELSPNTQKYVLKSLEFQTKQLDTLKPEFTDSQRNVLDNLQKEGQSLMSQLQSSVASAH